MRLDLSGYRFGMLLVESRAERVNGKTAWNCICDCGARAVKYTSYLRSGETTSCGCRKTAAMQEARRKHGCSGYERTAEYKIWLSMRDRCRNPNNKKFSFYGGRGIKVDPAFDDFSVFLEDVGLRPAAGLQIDRIDTLKGYEPGNVRWVTCTENQRNKRSNIILTLNGKSQTLTEWSRELGVPFERLRHRVSIGWSDERVLTSPSRYRSKK